MDSNVLRMDTSTSTAVSSASLKRGESVPMKSFMKNINKVGERTLPWGRPLSILKGGELKFSTLMKDSRESKIDLIMLNIRPVISTWLNLKRRSSTHTLSKAFSRSILSKRRHHEFLFSRLLQFQVAFDREIVLSYVSP